MTGDMVIDQGAAAVGGHHGRVWGGGQSRIHPYMSTVRPSLLMFNDYQYFQTWERQGRNCQYIRTLKENLSKKSHFPLSSLSILMLFDGLQSLVLGLSRNGLPTPRTENKYSCLL